MSPYRSTALPCLLIALLVAAAGCDSETSTPRISEVPDTPTFAEVLARSSSEISREFPSIEVIQKAQPQGEVVSTGAFVPVEDIAASPPTGPICKTASDCAAWFEAQGDALPVWLNAHCDVATHQCLFVVCGNDVCEADYGESAETCSDDCRQSPPSWIPPAPTLPIHPISLPTVNGGCGDGVCDGDEDGVTCMADCEGIPGVLCRVAKGVEPVISYHFDCEGQCRPYEGAAATDACRPAFDCEAYDYDDGRCDTSECVPPADTTPIAIEGSCAWDGASCGAGERGTCFEGRCYDMTCGNGVCDAFAREDRETCAVDCCAQ